MVNQFEDLQEQEPADTTTSGLGTIPRNGPDTNGMKISHSSPPKPRFLPRKGMVFDGRVAQLHAIRTGYRFLLPQCKTLVQARCKQAGMRWHTEGVEPLLRLGCALKDGRYWQDFGQWLSDLCAWQARRKWRGRETA